MKQKVEKRLIRIIHDFERDVFKKKDWPWTHHLIKFRSDCKKGVPISSCKKVLLQGFKDRLKQFSEDFRPIKRLYWRRFPKIVIFQCDKNIMRCELMARISIEHENLPSMKRSVQVVNPNPRLAVYDKFPMPWKKKR